MRPRVLLVNPSILDFAAYDFWLRPYGLLQVAGWLRDTVDLTLFDFLDRAQAKACKGPLRKDPWGRGHYHARAVPKPAALAGIPRRYRRFGIPRQVFCEFLRNHGPFDFALIQTTMTYWYLGVREAIEDIRTHSPPAVIVLGGVYATLCSEHAASMGPDLVIEGRNLTVLWQALGVDARPGPAWWEGYDRLIAGVLKLTEGCPFRCTYCTTPRLYPSFKPRPAERVLEELSLLVRLEARDVAFYDDALLYRPETALLPFLELVRGRDLAVRLHTPNALHARFVTQDVARAMVGAGFETFYLGYESASAEWHRRTGSKVDADDLADAVDHLRSAGVAPDRVTAYVMLGHPDQTPGQVEESMRRVHRLGTRIMLSEFSPIPGTPDGEACRGFVDMDEPLWHNNTAFPIARLGVDEVNRLKQLRHRLNADLDKG